MTPLRIGGVLSLLALLFVVNGCSKDQTFEEVLKVKATRTELEATARAIGLLVKDCGKNRVAATNLPEALCVNPGWSGWNGPYMYVLPRPTDLWETPIRYTNFLQNLSVIAAGLDKKFNTADDIVVQVDLSDIKATNNLNTLHQP